MEHDQGDGLDAPVLSHHLVEEVPHLGLTEHIQDDALEREWTFIKKKKDKNIIRHVLALKRSH